ncbi:hypothetical protein L3X38_028776 [Prunus dulcis]|uniref:Alcohol dehydrogenase-like N-terminal domain-containing protein n=1 Tax=Prunus dulcis TaxID=3755 RepID=A0AAD4Z1U0_PRUDU|nr:hypothetical protein L3X38_028776 [Prunus dulcis]
MVELMVGSIGFDWVVVRLAGGWALGTDDVSIKITHCGVCYADVIWTRNQHGDSKYPVVPGHEIAGIVKEVGSNVQRFKVGDHMGVGTHVNSCRDCEYCNDRFNGVDADGTITKGGYSSHIFVHEWYCFNIPENYPLASAAPLHFVLELLFMLRCTSISKEGEALGQLGADNFVVSSDRNQMKALVVSVDFIIEIASGDHPFDPYLELLKLVEFWCYAMKTISGSVTGGTKDIQEMIDFCASYGIHPMIEIIPIKSANEAIERLLKSVVIYRFVIDIENYLK